MKTDSAHHGPLPSSLSQLALVWGITEEPSAQHVPLSEVAPLPRSVPTTLPFKGIPRVTCVSQGHVHTHTQNIKKGIKVQWPWAALFGSHAWECYQYSPRICWRITFFFFNEMNGVYNTIILLMWWKYLTSKKGEKKHLFKNTDWKIQIEWHEQCVLSDSNDEQHCFLIRIRVFIDPTISCSSTS